jgi:ribonuclease HII
MIVAGVDEAGRGPLAGPVVAAAVILCDGGISGLNDSKKLSAKRRAMLEPEIKARCRWAIGIATVEEIDQINILQATFLAMTRAVDGLSATLGDGSGDALDEVWVDGNRLPRWGYKARAIVGGDALHDEISAASILAKEHRDALMREAAQLHPQYGWDRNAGYGTAQHMAALREYGPTAFHRRSFAPIAQLSLI